MPGLKSLSFLCLCIAWHGDSIQGLPPDSGYRMQFESGKAAYSAQRWQDCVNHLEAALAGHDTVKDLTADCQRRCHGVEDGRELAKEGFDALRLSAKLTRTENCTKACKNEFDDDEFDRLQVYSFLQHCYYQNLEAERAASVIFTTLRAAPEDKTMASYLQFYAGLPEVRLDRVVDLEQPSGSGLLAQAMAALNQGSYTEAAELTEKSLDGYLRQEALCRLRCQRRGHDADVNASPQVALVLEVDCKQGCSQNGVTLEGGLISTLLAEHYHYLHFAYLNAGKVRRAIEAAASFALVSPNDTRALTVVERYQRLLNAKGATFPARKEAVDFARRRRLENKLMQLVDNLVLHNPEGAEDTNEHVTKISGNADPVLMGFDNEVDSKPEGCPLHTAGLEASPEGTDDVIREQMNDLFCNHPVHDWTQTVDLVSDASAADLARHFQMPVAVVPRPAVDSRALRDELLQDTVLVKSAQELGGGTRVLAEGLANEKECQTLVKLAEVTLVPGNGHQGVARPFSRLETHAGVGFTRATNMTLTGEIGPELVDMMIDVGDRVKAFLERHFGLEEKLYFQFSELVCRTSTMATLRGEYPDTVSHPVHADNCLAEQNGRCEPYENRESLSWRAYSSLTYLNENFEGGEFFFTANLSVDSVQTVVRPKCGRMVAFSSGYENLHGVRGVRNGRRCAVATWFTTAPARLETSRVQAQQERDKRRLDAYLQVV